MWVYKEEPKDAAFARVIEQHGWSPFIGCSVVNVNDRRRYGVVLDGCKEVVCLYGPDGWVEDYHHDWRLKQTGNEIGCAWALAKKVRGDESLHVQPVAGDGPAWTVTSRPAGAHALATHYGSGATPFEALLDAILS